VNDSDHIRLGLVLCRVLEVLNYSNTEKLELYFSHLSTPKLWKIFVLISTPIFAARRYVGRNLCYGAVSVCLRVCLAVTSVYRMESAEDILKVFTPF